MTGRVADLSFSCLICLIVTLLTRNFYSCRGVIPDLTPSTSHVGLIARDRDVANLITHTTPPQPE